MKKVVVALIILATVIPQVFAQASSKIPLDKIYAAMSNEKTYINPNDIPATKAKKPYKIALAMVNVSTGFFKALADTLQSELKASGAVPLLADCESDVVKQVSQVENFIAQNVDAIIINPADPQSALTLVLKKAYQANIPVMAVDVPPTPDAPYMAGFVTDAYQLAYVFAEKLAKDVLAANPTGTIEYGLIGGTVGNPIAALRNQGARDAIKKVDTQGRIKEVSFLYAGAYSEESGLKTAENMLVAHPNIRMIIGTCDAHVVGATAAAKRQGLDKNIIMGGVDGSKAALEIMKSGGPIKAIGLNSPVEVGQTAARAMLAFLNDGKVPASRMMVLQPALVTPENISEYMNKGF
jgi:ribose transport system substrate-binding protein